MKAMEYLFSPFQNWQGCILNPMPNFGGIAERIQKGVLQKTSPIDIPFNPTAVYFFSTKPFCQLYDSLNKILLDIKVF